MFGWLVFHVAIVTVINIFGLVFHVAIVTVINIFRTHQVFPNSSKWWGDWKFYWGVIFFTWGREPEEE